MKTGAIVIGGDYQGLGIIRSLGMYNIPVYLIDSASAMAKASKFTKKFFKSPPQVHLIEESELFIPFLIQLANEQKLNDWVLFPTTDECVKLLSCNKQELSQYYKIASPEWEKTKILYNKKLTYELATQLNIPIPKTIYNVETSPPRRDPDTAGQNFAPLQFPVIIKPATKGIFYKKTKKKAFLVKNQAELVKLYELTVDLIDKSEIMVQEVIPAGSPGRGTNNLFSFCSMFKDGKVIARLCAKRLRQHPMDFGRATTYAEIVDIPELEELGTKLLIEAGYYGLSEIEFMWDPRDKRYKLLEVNPRTWGWHTLGASAGVNFPYILYKDLMSVGAYCHAGGRSAVADNTPLQKAKWIREITDVPVALQQILLGKLSINNYITSLEGKKTFAVWDIRDPLPFFKELFMLPYLWKTRGF